MESLHGPQWFHCLNFKARYRYIPLKEEIKPKMAFRIRSGQLYEPVALQCGSCTSLETFSWIVEIMQQGLTWEMCLAYLDDILVFSTTWFQITKCLEQLFHIQLAGFELSVKWPAGGLLPVAPSFGKGAEAWPWPAEGQLWNSTGIMKLFAWCVITATL